MLKQLLIILCVIPGLTALDADRRLLDGLDAVEAALRPEVRPGELVRAVRRVAEGMRPYQASLSAAAWDSLRHRLSVIVPRLPLELRITLVAEAAFVAPMPLQGDVATWSGSVLDEAVAQGRLPDGLGRLLPRAEERPEAWASLGSWRAAWGARYAGIYGPRAAALERLARNWTPAGDQQLGEALADIVRPHPVCAPLIRILLQRCATAPVSDFALHIGNLVLPSCTAPCPEGIDFLAALIAAGDPDAGFDLRILQAWRGEPRLGALLMPLMLAAGNEGLAGTLAREEPGPEQPWALVLAPPELRPLIVARLIEGLEAGLQDGAGAEATAKLACQVFSWPECYGGMLDAAVGQRLHRLLTGRDATVRLAAFHLLGHLAGPAGIDAAYAQALPMLRDLLLSAGPPPRDGWNAPAGFRDLDDQARMRLTLCRLPLEPLDRRRLVVWTETGFAMDASPVAAWLLRTAPAGVAPFAVFPDQEAARSVAPRWFPVPRTEEAGNPPQWRNDPIQGLYHLAVRPDWSEGEQVLAAADLLLLDPERVAGVPLHLALAARLDPGHPGLDAFAQELRVRAGEPGVQTQLWIVEILRGRNADFPQADWLAFLRCPASAHLLRVVQAAPQRFAAHAERLRVSCPPDLAMTRALAEMSAALELEAARPSPVRR